LKVDEASQSEGDVQTAVAGYTEAIRLDPEYALAFAARSLALTSFSRNFARGPAIRDSRARAQADARKAIALVPELAEGHLALAALLADDLEFTSALGEYQRALTLEPGNARVLSNYGRFAVEMGQTEAGLAAVHRSVALDPLNAQSQEKLGESLVQAHRLGEAIATLKEAKSLAPDDVWITAWLGFAYGHSGDVESAREVCESIKIVDDFNRLLCLVFTYDSLGRHADAEKLFTQMRASSGERPAVFYAMVYARRGDTARALEWLDTAMRHRDPYLIRVKVNPGLDPLRKEPRFQAIERELKFPD
jgi:tetratricopeptide (TPR) repeat protein